MNSRERTVCGCERRGLSDTLRKAVASKDILRPLDWVIVNIGKRLQELRHAKGFSQGDIEHRTGLLRCYVSRVENGHTVPNLETLEKWAKAFDLELYQLFFAGEGKPEAPRAAATTPKPPRGSEEAELLKVFGRMSKPRRTLLLAMARKMAATQKGK